MTEIKNVIIEFDYNIEQLNKVKEELSTINKQDIGELDTATKQLVKIRRAIQTKGKSYRDDANAFNKMVLSKEKEYLEIIQPLEVEYKELLEAEKERQIVEARKELLPNKKKQLSVLKIQQPTDEEILAMDENQWVEFYDQKFAEHEANIENEKRAEQEEKERKEREEQIKKEAEEKAKREAEEAVKRAEEEKKKAVEEAKKEAELKALREKQEEEEKVRQEKEAEEAKRKAEEEAKEKMEADKKYQDFLKANNYNEATDLIQRDGGEVKIFRLVATFKTK